MFKRFFRCECLVLVLVLAFTMVVGACATQGSALEQSEATYQVAEDEAAARKVEADAAKRAAEKAEADKVAAGKAHAGALMTDATERAKLAEAMVAEAEAQKRKACDLNPEMCGGATGTMAGKFVDVKLNEFTLAGATKLSDYPPGWMLRFEGGQFVLKGSGLLIPVVLVKPDPFKAGTCFRFTAVRATEITCPGTPASGEVR